MLKQHVNLGGNAGSFGAGSRVQLSLSASPQEIGEVLEAQEQKLLPCTRSVCCYAGSEPCELHFHRAGLNCQRRSLSFCWR